MTPATYQAARKRLGTQEQVAAMLKLDPQTISRRERGELPITREAALAIDALKARRERPAREKRRAMQAPNAKVRDAAPVSRPPDASRE